MLNQVRVFFSMCVFSGDSTSNQACGVKRGVGTSICIDADCKVGTHQGKFCHVLPDHVYVKKNDSTAFLKPSAEISKLTPEIKNLWETDAVSLSDWQARFQPLQASNSENLPLDETTESIKKTLTFRSPLQSPTLSPVKEDLCQDIPTFEPSLPTAGVSNLNEVVPPALLQIETALSASIKHYTKTLAAIQNILSDSASTARSKYDELTMVGAKVESLRNSMGNLASSNSFAYSSPTIASTIGEICFDLTNNVHPVISTTVSELHMFEGSFSKSVSDLKAKAQVEVDARLFLEKEVTDTVTTLIEMLSAVGSRLDTVEAALPNTAIATRLSLAELRASVNPGRSSSTTFSSAESPDLVDVELGSRVSDLTQRLTALELGSLGDGVSINGHNFDNLEELMSFMTDNDIDSVGEFVCVYVALQERISHNEGSVLLGRLEKQRKLNLDSNYEAYAVESFRQH